jgi:hypothetical protein
MIHKQEERSDKQEERFNNRFDNHQLQMYIAVVGILAATIGTAYVKNVTPVAI